MTSDPLKLVFVGDHLCGKTALILTQNDDGTFPTGTLATTAYIEGSQMEVRVDGSPNLIYPCDTAGEQKYAHLRPLNYQDAAVFVICFALDAPNSLNAVLTQWAPEVQNFCRCRPILLVGCKKDARDEIEAAGTQTQNAYVPTELGESIRKKINAALYVECSAKANQGVQEVFQAATRLAIANQGKLCTCKEKQKKARQCCVIC